MMKEAKVLGFYSNPEEAPMFKKDPTQRKQNGYKQEPGSRANSQNQSFGGHNDNHSRQSGGSNGATLENMMKMLVQQKMHQLLSQPNPNMRELVSMMQSYMQMTAMSGNGR